MRLFSYLSEWKKSVDLARIFRAGLNPFQLFSGINKCRSTNDEALMKRYRDWVYICASKNAAAVAQVPLRLYVVTRKGERRPKDWVHRKALDKKQSDYIWKNPALARHTRKAVEIEEVLDHPFLDLWFAPNPHTVGFTFRELITIDQEVTGDAYIFTEMDEALRIPKAFVRLPPQWTCVVPGKKEFIDGYLFGRQRNQRVALKPEEVVHFLYPNPRDPFNGMSPVQGSLSAVDIDASMSQYDLTLMDNQGRPDFLVSYKGKLNPAKMERLQKEWNRLYGNQKNVGRPAFLDQEADIKTLGWSPREMAFLSGRKWSMKQICNAHGVPVSKVDVDNVNRANADAGNHTYMKDTVYPRCIRQQETLNQNIIPHYDERLFVAYDNPVPEDKEHRLKERDENIKNGYSSINQERQKDNEEPVPWGHVPIMSFNVAPLGSAQPVPNQEPKGRSMVGYTKRQDVPIDRPLPVDTLPPMDTDEKRFERLMKLMFSEQEKDVVRLLEKRLSSGIYTIDRVENSTVILSAYPKGLDDAILDLDKWDVKSAAMIKPQVVAKMTRAGDVGLGEVGISVPNWIERPETVAWIQDHTFQFAKRVNATAENMLKQSLAIAAENGETIPQFKKRIREVFNLRRKEAERIARTEMNRAANGGTVEAWKQSGVVVAQEWDAANDACPFCFQMHGKTVALDGIFITDGEDATGYVNDQQVRMPMNYGDVHHPPLHPNCRCTLIPVVKEAG